METIEETTTKINSFYDHVIKFDQSDKNNLINIIQYSVIAIIPIVIINKLMQHYIPEADDQKSSLEISAEVFAQLIFMFVGMYFIHKLVTYIPSYTGIHMGEFNVIPVILPFLVILLSLQSKLGEKVEILVDRVLEMIYGNDIHTKNTKSQQHVRITQPIVRHQPSQADNLGNHNPLPPPIVTKQENSPQPPGLSRSAYNSSFNEPTNYDQMYQEPMTAQNNMSMQEPMASNAGFESFSNF